MTEVASKDTDLATMVQWLRDTRASAQSLEDSAKEMRAVEADLRNSIMNAMYNGHARSVEHGDMLVVLRRQTKIEVGDIDDLADEFKVAGIYDEFSRLDLAKAKKEAAKRGFLNVHKTSRDVLVVTEVKQTDGQAPEAEPADR